MEGSRKQQGDEDLDSVRFSSLAGKHLVIEEKMDGANAAVSFSDEGELRLQSRGHYLTGGPRERHFDLFKSWAYAHAHLLWPVLSDRYIMYGEWLYAKHTTFYNRLPHYFMEFDILDLKTGIFLSTEARREFLKPLPFVVSVKVLHEGPLATHDQMLEMVTPSYFIDAPTLETDLRNQAKQKGLDDDQIVRETDISRVMEGLYIKVEEKGEVTERLKYVRADFLQTLLDSNSHWHSRPIIPNLLAPGVDIFGG